MCSEEGINKIQIKAANQTNTTTKTPVTRAMLMITKNYLGKKVTLKIAIKSCFKKSNEISTLLKALEQNREH